MNEITPYIRQALKLLNEEIGRKEQTGEVLFFDTLLADNFIFRRASGVIMDKQRYLNGLASVTENPFEQLDTIVETVTLDEGSAVADVLVIAKRKNMERAAAFRNVRVFRREGENWKLVIWVNTKLGDVF
jgi:hypothetical protein